jgi:hypothetical protein
VGACKARAPAQGKKGLIDISELVGVEQDEADICQGTGAGLHISGLKVGDEIDVGVEPLAERELLAGVFFDRIAADFERRF